MIVSVAADVLLIMLLSVRVVDVMVLLIGDGAWAIVCDVAGDGCS